MAERIVVNTGPLIAFDRIGCLDVIGQLPYEFLSPEEVRRELEEGASAGHPRIAPEWLQHRALGSPPRLAGLDSGEAAVIQLALELGISTVAIDEWKGRRAALASGLKVTGALGLLGKAKIPLVSGLFAVYRP